MMSIQFVFPKRNGATGSVNMRVRQIYDELSSDRKCQLVMRGVLHEHRVRPWSRGYQFVWVKPRAWTYMWLIARKNRVLVDLLDSNVWDLPRWIRRSHNVEFIVCTRRQRDLILKFYPECPIHLVPHHYDPRLGSFDEVSEKSKTEIGYIGAKRKFVEGAEFDIEVRRWDEFLANPKRYSFHWAVRPANRMFHPETKVATALACGALPIVSKAELGTLLPIDYPFSIDDVQSVEECQELKSKLQDRCRVDLWRDRLADLTAQLTVEFSSEMYKSLLGDGSGTVKT